MKLSQNDLFKVLTRFGKVNFGAVMIHGLPGTGLHTTIADAVPGIFRVDVQLMIVGTGHEIAEAIGDRPVVFELGTMFDNPTDDNRAALAELAKLFINGAFPGGVIFTSYSKNRAPNYGDVLSTAMINRLSHFVTE